MSNRTDFDNQAREFLAWMRSQPAEEIQKRLERELNDAFVAGQEYESRGTAMSEDDLRAENRRLYEQNVQLRKDLEGAAMGREAMERTRDGVRERDLAKIEEIRAALAEAERKVEVLARHKVAFSDALAAIWQAAEKGPATDETLDRIQAIADLDDAELRAKFLGDK